MSVWSCVNTTLGFTLQHGVFRFGVEAHSGAEHAISTAALYEGDALTGEAAYRSAPNKSLKASASLGALRRGTLCRRILHGFKALRSCLSPSLPLSSPSATSPQHARVRACISGWTSNDNRPAGTNKLSAPARPQHAKPAHGAHRAHRVDGGLTEPTGAT